MYVYVGFISRLSILFFDIFISLFTNIKTFDCQNFIAILGIWCSECLLSSIQNCLGLVHEFYVKLLISVKSTVGILMRIALSLQVVSGKIDSSYK